MPRGSVSRTRVYAWGTLSISSVPPTMAVIVACRANPWPPSPESSAVLDRDLWLALS